MRTVSPVYSAAADAGVWPQQAEFLAAIARGFRQPYLLRLKVKRDISIPDPT